MSPALLKKKEELAKIRNFDIDLKTLVAEVPVPHVIEVAIRNTWAKWQEQEMLIALAAQSGATIET